MFLSIAIPIFNAGERINQCIESLLFQSEQDFELILVDDGSTDNSNSICHTWVQKYPNKIRLISKVNEGSLLTRRRCLFESKADYIYIMDADDYLVDIDALKKIKETIKHHNCDLVFFNCCTNKDTTTKFFNIPFNKSTVFEGETLSYIHSLLISSTVLNPLWNKVFSRSLVDWEEDYNAYAYLSNGTDMFQSIPIISNATKVVYIDEILYSYTIANNANSIIHTFNPNIFNSMKTNYIRLVQTSIAWNNELPDLDYRLKRRFMDIASSSAYRAKDAKKQDKKIAISYLKSIGSDDLFIANYTLMSIPIKRSGIVFMLKHHLYNLLYFLIRLL